MQKILTLFVRDPGTRELTALIAEGCEWVAAGEGVATRKWDGTACRVLEGELYCRHVLNQGDPMPPGWIHWDDDPGQRSGHGWRPVSIHPSDQWHREAWFPGQFLDGTYELLGPKVQKNVDCLSAHALVPHGRAVAEGCPRDFDSLKAWLDGRDIEGIVWHHPDGRMAKIKLRDFGLRRGEPR